MTSRSSEWTKLASFSSGFEADLAAAALESAGIPVVVQGHQLSGIFGVGFQGKVVGGVSLHVPSTMLDDAWTIVASFAPRAD